MCVWKSPKRIRAVQLWIMRLSFLADSRTFPVLQKGFWLYQVVVMLLPHFIWGFCLTVNELEGQAYGAPETNLISGKRLHVAWIAPFLPDCTTHPSSRCQVLRPLRVYVMWCLVYTLGWTEAVELWLTSWLALTSLCNKQNSGKSFQKSCEVLTGLGDRMTVCRLRYNK